MSETLLVLPLAPGSVLFPGQLLSFEVSKSSAKSIVESVATASDKSLLVVCAPQSGEGDSGLFEYGTLARVVRLMSNSGSTLLTVLGLSRAHLQPSADKTQQSQPIGLDASKESVQLVNDLVHSASSLLGVSPWPSSIKSRLRPLLRSTSPATAANVVDALVGAINTAGTPAIPLADQLDLLSSVDPKERVVKGIALFERLVKETPSSPAAGGEVIKRPLLTGTLFRKPPVSSIKPATEPDPDDEEGDDIARLEKAINGKRWTEESEKAARRELARLRRAPPQGSEHGVIRNYIETLLAVPWDEHTPFEEDRAFVERAKEQLDRDHFGLDKVKRRIVEYLTVLQLKQAIHNQEQQQLVLPEDGEHPDKAAQLTTSAKFATSKAPILLLAGPPGTGKTSVARSIAASLGRPFHRISLGGVRDEAEIRGHRRTYVGALPGAIVQALRRTGVSDPVILLDEVDKLGSSATHGDPGAALLEVLDPQQNSSFVDHYLSVPLDLSRVLFIASANYTENIPAPLYDRLEPLELAGYTHSEKLGIARRYLWPNQVKANALTDDRATIDDETLLQLVTGYTHEAGVRTLERTIGDVVRAKAVEFAQARAKALDAGADRDNLGDLAQYGYRSTVSAEDLVAILGRAKFEAEPADEENPVGVSSGLAYQGSGRGGILHIESSAMPGTGQLKLTGQLGEVITESAQLALGWVKSNSFALGIATKPREDPFAQLDLHIHLPSGSIKKDGPSAGVAIVVALVSLMRAIPTRKVAMTGEITLRGLVTPVGGIREKVLGAHRAGMRRLILPQRNEADVEEDLSEEVRGEIEFVYVRTVWDALDAAFEGARLWEASEVTRETKRVRVGGGAGALESRL